jgi:hypothetical protein
MALMCRFHLGTMNKKDGISALASLICVNPAPFGGRNFQTQEIGAS